MAQRILIVDDDPKITRLLRASLEQAGYRVLIAYDGETALHALRRERPDLVVLDLMLPDRDGWNVTHVMRGDATWRIRPSSCSPPVRVQKAALKARLQAAQVSACLWPRAW